MAGTNWAGNLAYGAARLAQPKTVAEAQEIVRTTPKLRTLGSRHCFNDIADTTGTLLSLEYLNQVTSLDRSKNQVTIEGGVRYSDLGPYLHQQGYALHNLASLPHISVAGACATGTHGSGVTLGGLATVVAAIEFIDAAGNLVAMSRETNPDVFPGAVVSLGALGVITRMTLDLLPDFGMHQKVYRDVPYDALAGHFREIMASGYSVSLFTTWRGDAVEQVWVKSRAPVSGGGEAPQSFHGGQIASKNMHPVAELDAVNCTDQMGIVGPAYDRLPHFKIGSVPAGGRDLQAEYFIAQEDAVAAVKVLRGLSARMAPVLIISEVRTVAADEMWMSPFYKRPSVALHFSFEHNVAGAMQFLPELEAALSPFAPRPHWGKLFTMAPQVVHSRYEKIGAFRALLDKHDPAGKFRNNFVDRNIFGRS
jgi:xylitol oxidase